MLKKTSPESEQGAVAVLFSILLVMLLSFAALALDGGRMYAERRHAQNAADAAAMAGARAKCVNQAVVPAALAIAAQNGFDNSGDDTVTVAVTNTGTTFHVAVDIGVTFPAGFARVMSNQPLSVGAEAVANCRQPLGGGGYAIFAGSETCNNTIDWSGSSTTVNGGVHTNNDIHVGGQANIINGILTYVDSVDAPAGKITYVPAPPANPVPSGVLDYPVTFDMADFASGGSYATAASAAGRYYNAGNQKIDMGWLNSQGLWDSGTNTLRPGIYYTADDIDLSASNLNGNVTFVARGRISMSGSSHVLSPYVAGLLAFTDDQPPGGSRCTTAVIKMAGSTQNWAGIIYAPNGQVEMSGSSNSTFNGSIIAYTVKMNGSDNGVTYDASLFPPAPPLIDLGS